MGGTLEKELNEFDLERRWIIYRDRCQSLEKQLSLLESERDRLRNALKAIMEWRETPEVQGSFSFAIVHGFTVSMEFAEKVDKMWENARTALESSQPEGREVDGWDKSEINMLKGLLAEVPTENVIDRMGLESRLQRLLEKKEVHYRAKRDVTVEALCQEITKAEEEWLDMPDSVQWEKALAPRLFEIFDIRKREG